MNHETRSELVVLVPQKALDRAKTRLRSVLSKEARIALSMEMLRHVLGVCRELPQVDGLFVCGPGELVGMAGDFGAAMLPGGDKGMRRDVILAAEDWRIMGHAAMLFVSSDLPLLTPEDLQALVDAWRQGAHIVLGPDLRERATNVMLVNEPEVFPYAFGQVVGPGSFSTHRDTAIGLGLPSAEVRRIGVQLDIDLPADIERLLRERPDNPIAQFCAQHYQEGFRFQ